MYAIHIMRKLILITEKSCLLGIRCNIGNINKSVVGHIKSKFTANHFQITSIANILNMFPHLSKGLLNKIRHTSMSVSLINSNNCIVSIQRYCFITQSSLYKVHLNRSLPKHTSCSHLFFKISGLESSVNCPRMFLIHIV